METIYTLQPTCAASPEDATAEPTTPHPWNCYVISVAFPSSLLAQRMCRWPCVAADQRLIFTTITRKDSRSRVHPPSQHTSQSPKSTVRGGYHSSFSIWRLGRLWLNINYRPRIYSDSVESNRLPPEQ